VGLVTERLGPSYSLGRGLLANVLGGIVVLYVGGIAGMMVAGHLALDTATSLSAVFVPGDLLKAVAAALVARGVHAGYPGLLPGRRRDENKPTPV